MKVKRVPMLITAIVILILLVFFRGVLGSTFAFFQAPLAAFGTWVSSGADLFLGAQTITPDELRALQERTRAFAIDSAETEQLRLENQELKELLDVKERHSAEVRAASILQRTVSPTASQFTIDLGSRDGLKGGEPVIASSGFFIGKVTNVGVSLSSVSVVTDPNVATAVTLLNETRTIGVAEGASGNLIRLRFIPADEPIEVNDLVITSGLESGVPAGLIVGVVNIVRPDPNAPFQEAILEPLMDWSHVSHVLVELNDL